MGNLAWAGTQALWPVTMALWVIWLVTDALWVTAKIYLRVMVQNLRRVAFYLRDPT